MPIQLKIPEAGESVTEGEVGALLKKAGDPVRKDEVLVTLESEKATVELPAPDSGTITQILKQKGDTAKVGEVIALLAPEAGPNPSSAAAEKKPPTQDKPLPAPQPAEPNEPRVMPAAERALAEHGLSAKEVQGSGPGDRILKEDVLQHVERTRREAEVTAAKPAAESPALPRSSTPVQDREEEVVPMSRLRRTVAERLVQAQHSSALLTTFNEIDMSSVIALRKEYGESFQQRYQVKLGFMSFFVKACIDALKQFPALNAEIRETNIVYHNYYDLGVAVGSSKGLVVPVLRNAERMSFAEIEIAIGDFA